MISIKDYIYGAAVVALLVCFGWYTVHERNIGKAHELAAVSAENARVTAAANAKIATQVADYSAKLKESDAAYSKALADEQSAHSADLQRLRQLAANHQGHPVLPSPGAPAAPSGSGGSSLIGLGYVSAELAAALHDARDDLFQCYAERGALTGK